VPGSVAQGGWQARFHFPRTDLSHGFGNRDSEGGEAVQDGDPDGELCNLAVEVTGDDGAASLARVDRTVHCPSVVYLQVLRGIASEAAVPKTVMIGATYLKAHRTASSLRVKKGGLATSGAALSATRRAD